jgi:hypothetical protein
MHHSRIFTVAIPICLFLVGQALGDTITFTSDPAGLKPNGFVSVDSPRASFTDTMGADLSIDDFSPATHGKAIICNGDDASRLRIDFTESMGTLTMTFGNDDPSFTSPGDACWLQVFNGATLAGTTSVTMNRDDINNQSISLSGVGAFNNALVWYGNSAGTPISLIEDIDDISFTSVPEPATAMVGFGMISALLAGRTRRARV